MREIGPEEEKLLSGKLFCPVDPELVAVKKTAHRLSAEYSRLFEEEEERRLQILQQLLGAVGENVRIQGPIFFNYGVHTTIGHRFFANYNLTVLDDAPVTIGDCVQLGPNVTIATPLHPLDPAERREYEHDGRRFLPCYARPVRIGNNVWIASDVTVCPGVTIGDGAVIGAGSVVTRDVPSGVVAAGNPCRVLRPIAESDRLEHHPELF